MVTTHPADLRTTNRVEERSSQEHLESGFLDHMDLEVDGKGTYRHWEIFDLTERFGRLRIGRFHHDSSRGTEDRTGDLLVDIFPHDHNLSSVVKNTLGSGPVGESGMNDSKGQGRGGGYRVIFRSLIENRGNRRLEFG